MDMTYREQLNSIANHPLQTYQWGKFREAWGNKVLYTKYGLITTHKIPFTKYFIGVFEKGPPPSQEMLRDLKETGKENNLVSIKLEPNVAFSDTAKNASGIKDKEKYISIMKANGCVNGKTLFTPTTFWINLDRDENDIFKNFSSKARYNIRLAERKGVKVRLDDSPKAFQKYLDLTFETTKRQGFYAHTPEYHRLMWKFLYSDPTAHGSKPIAHLLTAIYKKEIITTWVLFVWKNFLYYPYGASTDKHKGVMANNLMMWEVIKFGKKNGLSTFDLWGREEGKGFTKFKEGYNPDIIEFLGSWDLVINKPIYTIYRIAEKVRWYILKTRTKLQNLNG